MAMRVADLPNPEPSAVTWITSIEPWQREGLLRVRELLGIDADAVLRAGLTLALSIVGSIVPDDEETPPVEAGGVSGLTSPKDQAVSSVPGDGLRPESGANAGAP